MQLDRIQLDDSVALKKKRKNLNESKRVAGVPHQSMDVGNVGGWGRKISGMERGREQEVE